MICGEIDTPFILGILRPRIFLPSRLTEMQLSFVPAHERAHLRLLYQTLRETAAGSGSAAGGIPGIPGPARLAFSRWGW